ncbi:MAG TPA: DUF177 domain-containing protein [Haloplasmataceae bacterium]
MRYPLSQLLTYGEEPFDIDERVDFSDVAKTHHEIRKISDVFIQGTGRIRNKMIIFDLNIRCDVTLPCAVTLDDVVYPLDIQTREFFSFDEQAKEEDFEDDVTIVKGQVVELAPVVWQNIVVNIPLRVVSPNAYQRVQAQGDNFELISDELPTSSERKEIDPRFEKLKELLDKM